jgi:hypothetical protein
MFLQFLVIKSMDPDTVMDPEPHCPKMLDPDKGHSTA